MNLYNLAQDYQRLVDLAEGASDPDDLQAFTDTMEGLSGAIENKVIGCALAVRTIIAEQEAVDVEKDRLMKRSQALSNAVVRLKSYMQKGMEAVGTDKVKGDLVTVAIQNNPPKVCVDDATKVPDQFKKIETSLKVSDIATALKSGQEIEGVRLEKTRGIRIR